MKLPSFILHPSSFILSLMLLMFLSCCGYRFGSNSLLDSYPSISVPYVEGDVDGALTTEVIRCLASNDKCLYTSCGGRLCLKIKIIYYRNKNIGFAYDHEDDGELANALIPKETRLSALVEIEVVDTCSCEVILGPARISTSVDYDHDYYSASNGVNIFSLGQVSDSDEAYDAALHPLNVALAQKIVDYIRNCW